MVKYLLFILSLILLSLGYLLLSLLTPKQVFLQSAHPSYTLSKTAGFSEFKKYLNEIGFWRKNAQFNPATKSPETARNLYVVLTDVPQKGNNWLAGRAEEKQLLASFGYKMQKGDVYLYLHIDPAVAESSGLDVNDVFNTYLMRAVYMLVYNRGLLFEQHQKAADELINTKYKSPFILLKNKDKTGFNVLDLLIPTAYAEDCERWKCNNSTIEKRCVGGDSDGLECYNNKNCPGGICQTTVHCPDVGAYWEGHSGSSCTGAACPGDQCVVPNTYSCNCGGPAPSSTPTPPSDGGGCSNDLYPQCKKGSCKSGYKCGKDENGGCKCIPETTDSWPTASVSGPTTATVGTAVNYSATADDVGTISSIGIHYKKTTDANGAAGWNSVNCNNTTTCSRQEHKKTPPVWGRGQG